MKKKIKVIFACVLGSSMISACASSSAAEDIIISESTSDSTASDSANTYESYSHSNDTEPDFDIVFPGNQVNEIVITITPENWEALFEDMNSNYGTFGESGQRAEGGNRQQMDDPQAQNVPDMQNRPEGQGFNPPADVDWPQAPEGQDAPPQAGGNGQPAPEEQDERAQNRGGMGGGGMMMGGDNKDNPIWVEATIEFENDVWEHVGFRLKGNSSLKSTWNSGNYKLPFKLDFDQYEDEYPDTEDQRFYGFKQLTFSSNFHDSTFLVEKVSADIFRDAGVPAAHTAFYAVYVDYGEGPQYFGLYTAVEVVDDTVIQTQFEDDSGNVYKPSGSAATFAAGTYDEELYDKETNEDEGDYSDVQSLLEVLNSDLRTSDAAAWRDELESVFDVDNFLQWLAVNTAIQNWDTYGSMSHNYYLYHDPSSDQLVWIPWDNNEAFNANRGGGRNMMGRSASTSFDQTDTGENWPLISYLLADEVYLEQYNESVEDVITNVFNPDALTPVIAELHEMISPYIEAEEEGYTTLSDPDAFENSLSTLSEFITSRYNAALQYLDSLD